MANDWQLTPEEAQKLTTPQGYYTWLQGKLDKYGTASPDHINKIFIAGQTINGGNAVIIGSDGRVCKFDILNSNHFGKFLGMAATSSLENDNCVVTISGIFENVGAGWNYGEVYYIAENSMLSTTAPLIGIVKKIGVGVAPDRIKIAPEWEYEII